MTNSCAHEIGPWPAGQQWPRCLKCEIERLRERLTNAEQWRDYYRAQWIGPQAMPTVPVPAPETECGGSLVLRICIAYREEQLKRLRQEVGSMRRWIALTTCGGLSSTAALEQIGIDIDRIAGKVNPTVS